MMTRYCPSCGVVNELEAESCGRCGSRMVYDGTAKPKKNFLVPINRPMSEYEWNTRPRFKINTSDDDKAGEDKQETAWVLALFPILLIFFLIFTNG